MSLIIKDHIIMHEVISIDKVPEAFRRVVLDALGAAPVEIVLDGQFHRFRTEEDGDRPDSSLPCYYQFDPAAMFGLAGDFRRDQKPLLQWQAQLADDPRSQEEIERQREAFHRAFEEQEAIAHEDARKRSMAVWEGSSTDSRGARVSRLTRNCRGL